jgi:hypothetical protein
MKLPEPVSKVVRPGVHRFRRATAKHRMLPTFIIIGAQRAGTTTLFFYLRSHPDIEGPKPADSSVSWPKELHFFDEYFAKGVDWYRAFFPLERSRARARSEGHDLITGEATPYYLFHPLVPERVATTVPDVRLIVLLRDPIERAYSHYQLMVRTGREKLSFEEAVEAEPKRLAGAEDLLALKEQRGPSGARKHHHHRHRAYVGRSMYAEQIERWLQHFPREQLLAIRAEDFSADIPGVYSQALDFLGARAWAPKRFRARNIGGYAPIDPGLRARLEDRFAESNDRLAELLGWKETWGSADQHGRSLHSRR